VRRLVIAAMTVLIWGCTSSAALADDRPCGVLAGPTAHYAIVVVQGAVRCAEAVHVLDYVLAHGPPTMASPGRAPGGWRCGWGYLYADGQRGGRTGPACEDASAARGKRGASRRVDGRPYPMPPTEETDGWPFPVQRTTASPEAQAFMPLLFLDADEAWPLSNPDWFFKVASVFQCSMPIFGPCQSLSPSSMLDPSLRFLRFDEDEFQTGAPPIMFVNQTNPGRPPVPNGVPVSSAYRFFDYWWYYSFNRAPYSYASENHLSDWEGITVATGPGQPDRFDFVAMSAHEAAWNYLPEVLRCGEALTGETRHRAACDGRRRVNVYAAEGTHANFPRRCGDSLLAIEFDVPDTCLQTGLYEGSAIVPEDQIILPEGRFNGEDDGPSLMSTGDLKTLASVGPADWTRYPGFWDPTGDVRSPEFQARYQNPLDGSRQCTRRWEPEAEGEGEGAELTVPCDEEFAGPGASRLRALAAQAAGAVDPCEAWFGPTVSVSLCQPETLRQALVEGRLSEDGALRSTGAQGRSGSALGVSQTVGPPVTRARPVQVFGSGEPADVRARVAVGRLIIDARFDDVRLEQTSPFVITVTATGTVRARTPRGRILRPNARRRTDLRRPPRIARATASRRRGGVLVRFPRVGGRVAIDLLASRSGRPLATEIVQGRTRGGTFYGPPRNRARYVAVRRLSRAFVPSRPRVVRIRGS